jgi:hypothetical protein
LGRYILYTVVVQVAKYINWNMVIDKKNKISTIQQNCILFHDANPVSGHYEPLLYRKISICDLGVPHIYLSLICKDLESHMKQSMHHIYSHGLHMATTIASSCGDSLFNAICYLVATEFNVQ